MKLYRGGFVGKDLMEHMVGEQQATEVIYG